MKTSYLTKAFYQTAAQRFPENSASLHAAFSARLNVLRRENAVAVDCRFSDFVLFHRFSGKRPLRTSATNSENAFLTISATFA